MPKSKLDYFAFKDKQIKENLSRKCLIFGLGPSAKIDYSKIPKDIITFGVNDIGKYFTPDYTVYVDRFSDKVKERIQWFCNVKSKYVFSINNAPNNFPHTEWVKINHAQVHPNDTIQKINLIHEGNKVFSFKSSVIVAISIALYMGFKEIGLLGFDFTGTRIINPAKGNHPLSGKNTINIIDRTCKRIKDFAFNKKAKIYNLSNDSKITSFEKINLEDFYKLSSKIVPKPQPLKPIHKPILRSNPNRGKMTRKKIAISKINKEKLNVVCIKWGTKYSAEYVNNLYSMIKKNLTIPHRFICFTENNKNLNTEIEIFPFEENLEGWWQKLTLFKPKLFDLSGDVFYFDLDTIIIKNIDEIVNLKDGFFCLEDCMNKEYGTGIMKFEFGKYPYIWENFIKDKNKIINNTWGDQNWLNLVCVNPKNFDNNDNRREPSYTNKLRKLFPTLIPKETLVKYFPKNWFISYKLHWLKRTRSHLNKIIFFHGKPNPHEINDKILLNAWRGK